MQKQQYFTLTENLYTFDQFKSSGINISFTTRHGGQSTENYTSNNQALHVGDNDQAVLNNRQQLAQQLNIQLDNFIYTNQTHSDNVQLVTTTDQAKGTTTTLDAIDNCDGLYTFDHNLVLNAFVADCTPVYFVNRTANLVGVIHAGWQGTVKSIVYKTLTNICQKHNLNPADFNVVIGPSIEQENFEVGQNVIDLINQMTYLPEYTTTYTKTSATKYHANVKQLNYMQAIAAGVKAQNIYVTDLDTFSNDDFFSYRQNNQTGRMCASIYQTNN